MSSQTPLSAPQGWLSCNDSNVTSWTAGCEHFLLLSWTYSLPVAQSEQGKRIESSVAKIGALTSKT